MSARMTLSQANAYLEQHGLVGFRAGNSLCVRRGDKVVNKVRLDLTRTYGDGSAPTVASLDLQRVVRDETETKLYALATIGGEEFALNPNANRMETLALGLDKAVLVFHRDGRVVAGDHLKPDEAAAEIIEIIKRQWPQVVKGGDE